MRLFAPVPAPKYGCESKVEIAKLLQLKSVADKWKLQLPEVKSSHGEKISHTGYLEKPKIATFEPVEPKDAILMPIVGGKLSSKLKNLAIGDLLTQCSFCLTLSN